MDLPMKKIALIIFVVSSLLSRVYANCLPEKPQTKTKLASAIGVIENASIITRVPPAYPEKEARSGRDGWVKASYVIEPNGETSNILIEDSSGRKGFEKEAKRAISRWRFNPAIENGQPIQQCQNNVRLVFKMNNRGKGVSRKFMALYKDFAKALDQKHSDDIAKYAPRMLKHTVYAATESYYQFSILADYYQWLGDKQQQLMYLNKAIAFAGSRGLYARVEASQHESDILSEQGSTSLSEADKFAIQQIYPVLYKKLVLTLELELIGQALYSSEKLSLIAPNGEFREMFELQTQTLQQHVASNKIIKTKGVLSQKAMWNYYLLRNQFSFVEVEGTLHSLDVRCQNKRHLYTVNEQSTWTIPKAWKNCSLYINGEPNTTFSLVEYSSGDNTANIR